MRICESATSVSKRVQKEDAKELGLTREGIGVQRLPRVLMQRKRSIRR